MMKTRDDKVRLAVVGVGGMGYSHGKLFAAHDKAELRMLCGRTLASTQEKGAELGCKATVDYDDVLNDPGVNAVLISLPNPLHYPYALKALQAGKHVAVEYPITQTLAEFNQLQQLADEKQLVLHHGLTCLIEAPPRDMKALLPDIGQIMTMRSVYLGGAGDQWYTDSSKRGNFYAALTIHQIVYEYALTGLYPERVFGSFNFQGRCHSGSYMGQLPGGTISYNEWGMGFKNSIWQWNIEGTEGRILFEMGNPDTATIVKGDETRTVDLGSRMDAHQADIDSFVSQVVDGAAPYATADQSRRIIEICEACQQSAETGKVITL